MALGCLREQHKMDLLATYQALPADAKEVFLKKLKEEEKEVDAEKNGRIRRWGRRNEVKL